MDHLRGFFDVPLRKQGGDCFFSNPRIERRRQFLGFIGMFRGSITQQRIIAMAMKQNDGVAQLHSSPELRLTPTTAPVPPVAPIEIRAAAGGLSAIKSSKGCD
jgi:hypothetical protein